MVKSIVFLGLVLGVIIYPVVISGDFKPSVKKEVKKLPKVEFKKGTFYLYNHILEKTGNFDILNIYKNRYVAYDINAADLIKKERYKADKSIFQNNIVLGYNVTYQNKDLTLKTKKARYDKKTKILTGGKFQLYSDDFRGYGNDFKVDSKRNLYADDIKYFIKVNK